MDGPREGAPTGCARSSTATAWRRKRLTQANASLKKPDPRQPEFRLAKDLKFELPNQRLLTNGLATIRFAPDGTLEETDLKYFLIKGKRRGFDPHLPVAQPDAV